MNKYIWLTTNFGHCSISLLWIYVCPVYIKFFLDSCIITVVDRVTVLQQLDCTCFAVGHIKVRREECTDGSSMFKTIFLWNTDTSEQTSISNIATCSTWIHVLMLEFGLWRLKAAIITALLSILQLILNLWYPICKCCLLQYNANKFSLKTEPIKKTHFHPHYLVIHNTLSIPSPASLCEVIDSGKLNQSGKDKGVADGDEPVHGSGISDLGKGVSCTYTECCHCEDGGYTWRYERKTVFH